MSDAGTIHVLVVDDHRVLAEALATALALEPDIRVVGTVGTVREAMDAVRRSEPDVLLLDYELPDGHGTEISAWATARWPRCHAVMLTQFDDMHVLAESAEAGASAFLPKTSSFVDVAAAVRSAHDGESLLPASALRSLLNALRATPSRQPDAAAADPGLTSRELEVLGLLAQGYSNADIADLMVVSRHTVRTHVQNVLYKLGVHSKLAAVSLALRLGLVKLPER